MPEHHHLQTIPRDIVHRAAISEVFVTSLVKTGDDEYVTGAQLPRSHAFYGDHVGELARRYDPMMVMEAARQSGMAVVHEFFGVPLTMSFLLRTFNGRAFAADLWQIRSAPADLTIVVRVVGSYRSGEMLSGLSVQLDVRRDGQPMMVVDSKFSWIPRPDWDALRRSARRAAGFSETVEPMAMCPRASAAEVGRESRRNVVISAPRRHGTSVTAFLVNDLEHPTLFDHPLDHVPGSLQIEACRQLGWALLGQLGSATAYLECVKSTFTGFLELDRPSVITAELASTDLDRVVIACCIRQNGRPASEFVLGYAVADAAA